MEIPAIKKLGGPDAVVDHLHRVGITRISTRGVRGWQSRGRMPGYAILELSKWAKRKTIVLKPEDFEPAARPPKSTSEAP